MRASTSWCLLSVAGLLAAACDGAHPCTPGAQVSCACADGALGFQVCAASGESLERCVCGDGAGGEGGGDGGTGGAAPVLLVVQDRSGSMSLCFGSPVEGSHTCKTSN